MLTRSRRLRQAMALGLVAAAGAVTTPDVGAQAVATPPTQTAPRTQAAPAPPAITLAEISRSFEALTAQVGSSTVQVLASGLALDTENATGDGVVERRRSSGSGVILDAAGYVMTNFHVVQGARRVQVVLASRPQGESIVRPRGRTLDATVVGVDEETDLALLKVAGSNLSALPLGDSDTLKAGQLVFAFGSPLGLDNTVTMGIVSAVGRQLEPDDPMVYIQTDAPINPGSSGGPLVDAQGQVVGINTMILSQGGGNEGLGFAAPSNIVRSVYEQLKSHGRVRRGTIGVVVQTISAVLADALDLPQESGAFIADVDAGGPAARGGLRIGDIVVGLDGKPIENGRQLDVNLYRRAAGEVARLEVVRGKERLRLAVEVDERGDDPMRFAQLVTREQHLVARLGVLAISLTAELRQDLDLQPTASGALVAARASEDAVEYGIQPGDLIVAVNKTRVASLEALRAAVTALPARSACALQVFRQGQFLFLAFEIEE